jgi:hypothetical protein
MHVFRRPAATPRLNPGSPKPLKTGNRQTRVKSEKARRERKRAEGAYFISRHRLP